ncbi:MAG: hypothetical protein EB084_26215, partial [Proteobacteria bacterium]|nr:hypothetical protein [Pseudomonadota bacterium]
DRARSNPDEARRNAALAAGQRRIAEFKTRFEEIGANIEPGVDLVAQMVAPISWGDTEAPDGIGDRRAFLPGTAFSLGKESSIRVNRATVRTDFVIYARQRGRLEETPHQIRGAALAWGGRTEPWTYATEQRLLISKIAGSTRRLELIADLPLDLAEHATDLWLNTTSNPAPQRQPLLRLGPTTYKARFPIIALDDGRVVYPMYAGFTPPLGDEDRYDPTRLFGYINTLNPTVYPLCSPEGRSVWIDALRSDKIVAPKPPSESPPSYARFNIVDLVPARATRSWWEAVTRRFAGGLYEITENVLAEILRQRSALTEERVGERFWASTSKQTL